MKKIAVLAIVACLGLGAGIYTAMKTNEVDFSKVAANQQQFESWNVKHTHWVGRVKQTAKDRVRSDLNGDMATIISNKNGLLTVKWDRWGTETFECNDKNMCTLKK